MSGEGWDSDDPGFLWLACAPSQIGETARVDNKTYIRIPGGELQIGHVSGRIVAWVDGTKHTLRAPEGMSDREIMAQREAHSQSMIRLWHDRYRQAQGLLREVSAAHVLGQVQYVEHLGIKLSKDLWERIGNFVGGDGGPALQSTVDGGQEPTDEALAREVTK